MLAFEHVEEFVLPHVDVHWGVDHRRHLLEHTEGSACRLGRGSDEDCHVPEDEALALVGVQRKSRHAAIVRPRADRAARSRCRPTRCQADYAPTAVTFAIRRLGPGDEAVLALIAEQAFDFDLEGLTGPEPPLSASDAASYLADPGVLHWVTEEEGGRVVGELLCHLLRLPSGAGRELLLYSIGVRENERRRGVGTALVREMLRWRDDTGVPEVWVLADNPGAEAFYAACGFRRGADSEQGVLMILNTTSKGDYT